MKVRLLKDWGFHKAGSVVDAFEPTAKNWLLNGIAEQVTESRAVVVETADERTDGVERAVRRPVARKP
jgi:hypothetical protein